MNRIKNVLMQDWWGAFLRDSGFVQPLVQAGGARSGAPLNNTMHQAALALTDGFTVMYFS